MTANRLNGGGLSHIDVSRKDHVEYWTSTFGISEWSLRTLVQRHGSEANVIRREVAQSRRGAVWEPSRQTMGPTGSDGFVSESASPDGSPKRNT